MRYLIGDEKMAIAYFNMAAEVAEKSTCLRAKCGAVIIKDWKVIGKGFNSPPGGLESQRRCSFNKDNYDRKVTDKTCCIHAKQRAILDALRSNGDKIVGSRLYFTRIDDEGDFLYSEKPYCTLCSKLSLDVGISDFVLWHEEGICVYDTAEYNRISYEYKG